MFKLLAQKYMDSLFFLKTSKILLGAFLVSIIIFTTIHDSYAAMGGQYGAGRMRSCSSSGDPGGLEFNPTYGGKDAEFVLSNEICLIVIARVYLTVISAIAAMNGVCGTGSAVPRLIPSILMDSVDIAKASFKFSNQPEAACGGAITTAFGSFASAMIELGIIYTIASNTYENTSICGFGWKNPNHETKDFSADGIAEKRNLTIQSRIREYQANPAAFENDPEKRASLGLDGVDDADQTYREYYYGGIEVEDKLPIDILGNTIDVAQSAVNDTSNISDSTAENAVGQGLSYLSQLFNTTICRDPLRPKGANGLYPPQRYYMRGTQAGNFNCARYMNEVEGVSDSDMRLALGCCQTRSKKFVCIDSNNEQLFCKAGSKCDINGITFSTKFIDNDRMICAESYSLCPYNFTLSGGTEVCDSFRDGTQNSAGKWDIIDPEDVENGNCSSKSEIRNADCTYNEKAGKCKNYCQYLTHCAFTSAIPFDYKTSIGSPYFSTACLDFKGDSQNKNGYSGLRHFSLPIAQCMKETLENLFYNRAGHSMCSTVDEYPDQNNSCHSGYAKTIDGYDYQKGGQVEHKSFFERIQDGLRDFIRLLLIFAVMFFGIGVLIGKINLASKKDSIIFIVKFGLVLYFSLGTAWQSKFFDGVYNASSDFAMMVFKINAGEKEIKRDGCQFGDITLPDGTVEDSGRNYPSGKKYLAIFDTLDCKLARYLGFGPSVNVANIAKLVLAGFFIGPIGIYLSLCVLIMGFFMLALTIRALHIFLSSILGIVLMVLISPLIIPTVLFEKTNNLFKGWLKQLISFTLQPMILFAYIAIFVTIVDASLLGSATFSGKAPNKKISCEKNCYFKDTGLISLQEDGVTSSECTSQNEEFIDPMNDSVACLINIDNFGRWPGLEWLGISIPIIENIFSGNVKQKILTLLKGALIMMLLYGFMDEISGISSQIIGGASLPSSKADPMAMFSKIAGKPGFSFSGGFSVDGGAVNEAQKRMTRGAQKVLKKGGEKALEQAKGLAQRMGNNGKGAQEGNEADGNNSDTSASDSNASNSGSKGEDSPASEK